MKKTSKKKYRADLRPVKVNFANPLISGGNEYKNYSKRTQYQKEVSKIKYSRGQKY